MPRRLAGTNHVALTVTDLDRSTEWYCRVFGLTVVSTDENIGPPYFTEVSYRGLFDLTTLSYIVALVQHPQVVEGFDPCRVGLDHFGLQVPDVADLPEWAAHLDDQGVERSEIVRAPYAHVDQLPRSRRDCARAVGNQP